MDRTSAGALCLGLLVCAAATLGCAPRKSTIASMDDTPTDQWSRGVWLYGQHCASCHGEHGEGDEESPALAGEAAYSTASEGGGLQTAADLHAYAQGKMPPMNPGSLREDEYWAIVRYVLDMGGSTKDESELDAVRAAKIKLRP